MAQETATLIIQAAATVGLVVVTGVYVYLTWRLVSEAKGRPYLYATLSFSRNHLVMLVIANCGPRAAYNVQCRVSQSSVLRRICAEPPWSTSFEQLMRGIECLPPSRRVLFALPPAPVFCDAGIPEDIGITLTYGERLDGARTFEETFPISFREHVNTPREAYDEYAGVASVAEELGKIRHSMEMQGRFPGDPVAFAHAMEANRRAPCPRCAEDVRKTASLCPHCNSELLEGWSDEPDEDELDALDETN